MLWHLRVSAKRILARIVRYSAVPIKWFLATVKGRSCDRPFGVTIAASANGGRVLADQLFASGLAKLRL